MTKAIWSQSYSDVVLGHGNTIDMRLFISCVYFVLNRDKFIHNCILLTVFNMDFLHDYHKKCWKQYCVSMDTK